MVLDDPRPRRGRWVWPLLIVIVLVAGLWALAQGGQSTNTVDQLAAVREVSVEVSRTANVVGETLDDLATTQRDEFQVVMSNAVETVTESRDVLQEVGDNRELDSVMVFLDAALQQWSIGLSSLQSGVLDVVDFPGGNTGSEEILAGTQQLRLGDIAYAAARDAFESAQTPEPIGNTPEIRFIPEERSVYDLAGAYETAASAENSTLGLLPSLSVAQVVTTPDMVTDPTGIGVMPYTEDIDVQVVVANEGNSPSVTATLELRLTATVGALDPIIEEVPVLASGESTTIEFNDLEITPDSVYEMAVILSGMQQGADLETDDNTVVFQFRVNPETADTTTGPTVTTVIPTTQSSGLAADR